MAKAEAVKGFDKTKVQVLGHIVVPSLSLKGLKIGDELFLRYESEITSKEQIENETSYKLKM